MPGGFKRINYGGSEEIFELRVLDGTGREVGKWKNMKSDFVKTLKMINKKYGFNWIIKERRREPVDQDLDWAR